LRLTEYGAEVMPVSIPQALKAEHDVLDQELAQATRVGGRTGETAKAVARVLHPHFVKEAKFALPPLGLLAEFAENPGSAWPSEAVTTVAIAKADRLKAALPQLLGEHREIVQALNTLTEAARAEGYAEYARFAQRLILHVQTEEEVFYPATILLGEYLKMRQTTHHRYETVSGADD
jgi:hypothetical protein